MVCIWYIFTKNSIITQFLSKILIHLSILSLTKNTLSQLFNRRKCLEWQSLVDFMNNIYFYFTFHLKFSNLQFRVCLYMWWVEIVRKISFINFESPYFMCNPPDLLSFTLYIGLPYGKDKKFNLLTTYLEITKQFWYFF